MNISKILQFPLMLEVSDVTHIKIDPYDNHDWIRIISLVVYCIGLIGVGFIGIVIWYESSGRMAPYRTVTNQLVSCTLLELIIYEVFIVGLDILRMWTGPLPENVCLMINISKSFLCLSFVIIVTILAIMKFLFLCILKRVPEIDDDFLSRIIISSVMAFGSFVSALKYGFWTRPSTNECICMGRFDHEWNLLDKRPPLDIMIFGFCIIVQNVLAYPIFRERRRIENEEIQGSLKGKL